MKQTFLQRIFIYQKERFPVLVHIPLIMAFSFSAIGYSRACRGADGFIHWSDYLACICTNVILFFMLRVADEHKDRVDDAMYRTYLPVPRGLVTLRELSIAAIVLFMAVTILNLFFYQTLLLLYTGMMLYLLLMRYEFFIPEWLKKHQLAYIISHMAIIPLADVYASSYDWKLNNVSAPTGLLFFLYVSYLSGIILEIGRKLRVADTEEPGVVSYTKLWGIQKAPAIWMGILTLNFLVALIAAMYAGHGQISYVVLILIYVLSLLPAVLFITQPTKAKTKWVELMSLVWALSMYLVLGGIPLLLKLTGLSN